MQRKESVVISKALEKRRKSRIFNESHYEEIIHPNDEKEEDTESDEEDEIAEPSWKTSRFVKWFSRYDENVLKPFFIRKYNKAVMLLEDEYQELIKQ